MATGHCNLESKFLDTDIFDCSICLEKFKTPKYLPCLHTFCEACLNTYIISSLKSGKIPPEHFNCPVCRAEVKPPDAAAVDKWASLMPVNHMINSLMEKAKQSEKSTEKIECDPCGLDGDNISAEFWCFECQEHLCERCKKEHSRQKSSRSHKIVPACDAAQHYNTKVATEIEEPCTEHKGEVLKVYCIDHQKMCCVLCLSINHRKCENIKTFDEMAENMKKTGEVEQFSDEMKEMNSKAAKISTRKRENITSIQEQQTTILDKTDSFIQEAKSKLNKCHQEFKNKVLYLHKEQTTKLLKAADEIENFQNSLANCQKIWTTIIESGSPKQIFVAFEKIKERIETHRKELDMFLKEDQIVLFDIKMNKQVTDITTLTSVAELRLQVSPSGKPLSLNMVAMSQAAGCCAAGVNKTSQCIDDIEPVRLWDVNDSGWFSGGTFLSDGRLLLLKCNPKTLDLYSDDGRKHTCYGVSYRPWDAVQHSDDNIYVTSNSDKKIRIYKLSPYTIQEVKSIKTDISLDRLNAINITPDNLILVENSRCIYIMTMDGKTKRTIKTSESNSYIATSTSDTGSVFYYCDGTEVVCQSVSGKELLRYKIPGVKGTRGISLDTWGNIYVCGMDSKNVHVVSKDGKLSRVLLSKIVDVCKPYKVGFDRNGNKFFVTGFDKGTTAVYKLNTKKI